MTETAMQPRPARKPPKPKAPPVAPINGWTITWRGHRWVDDEITVQHLAALAMISGDDSFGSLELDADTIRDYPGEGYMRLVYMISALAGVKACEGLEGDEAMFRMTNTLTEIQNATAVEILAAITFR